jgi:peptidoglycan/LPS O-acetylase OafA/YrhL
MMFKRFLIDNDRSCLSNFTKGRDNNFNLIRFFAALLVLITHSFAIVTGDVNQEPFRASLGISLGTVAVDIFFITSGFLVTASLLTRKSLVDFVLARFLRIFPALWVMLGITFFGGLWLTSLTLSEFLTDSTVYKYFLKCSTLLFGVAHTLPGVFHDNPYPAAINGSLWTMPNELRMYATLAIVWFVLSYTRIDKLKGLKIFVVSVTIIVALVLFFINFSYESSKVTRFLELFFMFFIGASYYVLKEYIVLKFDLFVLFLAVILVSGFVSFEVFNVCYKILIPYVLFCLVYLPKGYIRNFNQFGDYSYGIYIYAFPVQQSTVMFFPDYSIAQVTIISILITLTLAIISWHKLEKPCLA